MKASRLGGKAMTSDASILDELERDLGAKARLDTLLNVGGQLRYVPTPGRVEGSVLAKELGLEIVLWLAGRYGGEDVTFPSRRGAEQENRAALLRAAVLEAGLTHPSRSANDIAAEFGVSLRRIHAIRAELRADAALEPLPLFANI